MIIKEPKEVLSKLGDLAPGCVFSLGGDFYMVMERRPSQSTERTWYVRLKTGYIFDARNGYEVKVYDKAFLTLPE